MFIPGAKFEEHCSNSSRDTGILDLVFYCFIVLKQFMTSYLLSFAQYKRQMKIIEKGK